MENKFVESNQYTGWLKDLKSKFRNTQIKAAVSVNKELLQFYWELGADIIEQQKESTWGSGFLKKLSADLIHAFPDTKGFSYRNLRYIRSWFLFYRSPKSNLATACCQIEKQAHLFQIPWGHNLVIISKCQDTDQALFYIKKTIENNWSRSVLIHQIESGLHKRQSKAISNFESTLPAAQSDLANEILKDPYNFDFIALTEDYKEKELENELTQHITSFLLELGAGFAYVGKQVHLDVGGKDFYPDLLFYHTRLHCYVVIELKVVEFAPEHAGKLNFYISAIDSQIKTDSDNPTIGILLCKNKNKIIAEYSLKNINTPMGVSEYELAKSLPKELESTLPSIEQIEKELEGLQVADEES